MASIMLYAAAVLCVVTAAIHSYFGEQRLIGPVVGSNHGVMASPLAKQVLRFAWHWTSALWVLIAAFLAISAQGPVHASALLVSIGVVHLIAGILDGMFTGGKHIGWPPITLIGVLVLLATFLSPI